MDATFQKDSAEIFRNQKGTRLETALFIGIGIFSTWKMVAIFLDSNVTPFQTLEDPSSWGEYWGNWTFGTFWYSFIVAIISLSLFLFLGLIPGLMISLRSEGTITKRYGIKNCWLAIGPWMAVWFTPAIIYALYWNQHVFDYNLSMTILWILCLIGGFISSWIQVGNLANEKTFIFDSGLFGPL